MAPLTRLKFEVNETVRAPAQGLKPALLHACDAALKGPLFYGAADSYATLDITLSTSHHSRHPTT